MSPDTKTDAPSSARKVAARKIAILGAAHDREGRLRHLLVQLAVVVAGGLGCLLSGVAAAGTHSASADAAVISQQPLAITGDVDTVPGVVSQASASANWAGFVEQQEYVPQTDGSTTLSNPLTSVTATWRLPRARCSMLTSGSIGRTATWVGLGGAISVDVAQIGVMSECDDGQSVVYAWEEVYPSYAARTLSLHVVAGDTVTATAQTVSAGRVRLTFDDVTRSEHQSGVVRAPVSVGGSAEAIVEAPSIEQLGAPANVSTPSSLAPFGAIRFADLAFTAGTATGTLGDPSLGSAVSFDLNADPVTGALVNESPLTDLTANEKARRFDVGAATADPWNLAVIWHRFVARRVDSVG